MKACVTYQYQTKQVLHEEICEELCCHLSHREWTRLLCVLLAVQCLGMWRSQPISASVGCGFHVQNPSDADADLSRDQNY